MSKLKTHGVDKLTLEKESVVMENNKPLIINMEKTLRRHYQNSQ